MYYFSDELRAYSRGIYRMNTYRIRRRNGLSWCRMEYCDCDHHDALCDSCYRGIFPESSYRRSLSQYSCAYHLHYPVRLWTFYGDCWIFPRRTTLYTPPRCTQKYRKRNTKNRIRRCDRMSEVISRILCLDIYLSRREITLSLKHEPSTEAEPTHLHHLGFTKTCRLLGCLSARKRLLRRFALTSDTVTFPV